MLPSARVVINWRAFSLASFFILLASIMWEATLAIPYGWWNYRDEQMLGVRITAWGDLPVEAVCLWMAVAYATVIIYETVKCWQASGKSMRRALFGEPARQGLNRGQLYQCELHVLSAELHSRSSVQSAHLGLRAMQICRP